MAYRLRGDYKQSDYDKVILPFTVLRRLGCVLEPTKTEVLEEKTVREGQGLDPVPFLLRKAGQNFHHTSPLDTKRLMGDQDNISDNLRSYIQAFTPEVRDIFESFEFHIQVDRLEKAGLLYMVCERFAQIDLHPETVSYTKMGLVFEELIRKFAELSNETAGAHFTPREVIRLMVNLIFTEDDQALTKAGIVRSLYASGAGTGCSTTIRLRGRGGAFGGDEPLGAAGAERSGAQSRELCDLQGRYADQGAGHQEYPLRQYAL